MNKKTSSQAKKEEIKTELPALQASPQHNIKFREETIPVIVVNGVYYPT